MSAPEIVLRLAPRAALTVAPDDITMVLRRGEKSEIYVRGTWVFQPIAIDESVESVCAKVDAARMVARQLREAAQ